MQAGCIIGLYYRSISADTKGYDDESGIKNGYNVYHYNAGAVFAALAVFWQLSCAVKKTKNHLKEKDKKMAKERKYGLTMAKDDLKELTTCEIPMALGDLLDEYESTNDQQLIVVIMEYLLLWSNYQQAAAVDFSQQPL